MDAAGTIHVTKHGTPEAKALCGGIGLLGSVTEFTLQMVPYSITRLSTWCGGALGRAAGGLAAAAGGTAAGVRERRRGRPAGCVRAGSLACRQWSAHAQTHTRSRHTHPGRYVKDDDHIADDIDKMLKVGPWGGKGQPGGWQVQSAPGMVALA